MRKPLLLTFLLLTMSILVISLILFTYLNISLLNFLMQPPHIPGQQGACMSQSEHHTTHNWSSVLPLLVQTFKPRPGIIRPSSILTSTTICLLRSSDGAFLDAYNGSLLFKAFESGGMERKGYLIEHTIYYLKTDHQLCAKDIVTNHEHWCRSPLPSGPLDFHPSASGDLLFVHNQTLHSQVLRSNDGMLLWSAPIPLYVSKETRFHENSYFVGTILHGTSEKGPPCVFATENRAQLWCLPALSEVFAVGAGLVIAHSTDNNLTAYHIENGTIAWQTAPKFPCDRSQYKRMPVLSETMLFCGNDQHLLALSLSTGAIVWQKAVHTLSTFFYIEQDNLLSINNVRDNTGRYAWIISTRQASDGHLLWQRTFSSLDVLSSTQFDTRKAYINKGIFYLLENSAIIALRINDGRQLWRDVACNITSQTHTTNAVTPNLHTQNCYWSFDPVISPQLGLAFPNESLASGWDT